MWSDLLPAVQMRVARPTAKLQDCVRFYHQGLGLDVIGSFSGHAGFSGVMLGLPGLAYHLELTSEDKAPPPPPPSPESLLVFYIPYPEAIERIVLRLAAMGHHPVHAHNPYWDEHGITFSDPDGWHVVLARGNGLKGDAPG